MKKDQVDPIHISNAELSSLLWDFGKAFLFKNRDKCRSLPDDVKIVS